MFICERHVHVTVLVNTDRRRDSFSLHQVLIDLPTFFIIIHAVVQILLILHAVLAAAHMTQSGRDVTSLCCLIPS